LWNTRTLGILDQTALALIIISRATAIFEIDPAAGASAISGPPMRLRSGDSSVPLELDAPQPDRAQRRLRPPNCHDTH
jgi:hypothetical protein